MNISSITKVNPFQYFTIRCLTLHTVTTVIGYAQQNIIPLWFYQSTKALVSICSIFGTIILYSNISKFAQIFGSKYLVYGIDFVIHVLPLGYIVFLSKHFNNNYIQNESLTLSVSNDYAKFMAVQISWFSLYIFQHDPKKIYFISQSVVVGLISSSLVLSVPLWYFL